MGKLQELEGREVERIPSERNGLGMILGVVTFLIGVALLVVTFKLAYDLFSTPPTQMLEVSKDKAIDLGKSGSNLAALIVRVLLLIVMGLMGSLIANRGISMFASSSARRHPPK